MKSKSKIYICLILFFVVNFIITWTNQLSNAQMVSPSIENFQRKGVLWSYEQGASHYQPSLAISDVTGDGVDEIVVFSNFNTITALSGSDGKLIDKKIEDVHLAEVTDDFTNDGVEEIMITQAKYLNYNLKQLSLDPITKTIRENWSYNALNPSAPITGYISSMLATKDLTDDGKADVVVAWNNLYPSLKSFVQTIDGSTGNMLKIRTLDCSSGESVNSLAIIDDLTSDNISEIAVGTISGCNNKTYILDGSNLSTVSSFDGKTSDGGGGLVASHAFSGLLLANAGEEIRLIAIDAYGNLTTVWSFMPPASECTLTSASTKYSGINPIGDLNGDQLGIDDVLVGVYCNETYPESFVYIVNGVTGNPICHYSLLAKRNDIEQAYIENFKEDSTMKIVKIRDGHNVIHALDAQTCKLIDQFDNFSKDPYVSGTLLEVTGPGISNAVLTNPGIQAIDF